MRNILLFLLFCFVLSNCASTPPLTPQEIQALKQENLNKYLNEYRNLINDGNEGNGYNYCADQGKFYYHIRRNTNPGPKWIPECGNSLQEFTFVEGIFGQKPVFFDSCIELGFYNPDDYIDENNDRDSQGYAIACKLAGPTRLYDERKIEISKLSDEFLCIKQQQSKDPMFDAEVKKRQLSSQCYEIFADYQFAIKVDSQKKNCKKIGYEENTPAMADCIKEFILSETNNTNTSTTVVVEGSSSGSSDAVAEELRKMNKRQSIEYYNKMMKTGYDMMTCYTWPNC